MNTQTTARTRDWCARPRGTELTCKGWLQEAALRMLMNNLDPEVAERPGRSRRLRRHRQGGAHLGRLRRHRARRCAASRTTRRCSCSRASRSASSQTHEMAPRVLIANANLVGRLGDLGRVPPARGAGPDDVRADDGRLVDLHRHAGHPAGHLRDVRRRAARSTSARDLAGRLVLTAGLGGMGGAQPLAATMTGGVALCVEVDPHAHRAPPRDRATSTWPPTPRRGARLADEAPEGAQAALASRSLGNAADVYPRARAPRRRPRPRDRPDLGARPAQRLRAARPDARRGRSSCARDDPDEYVRRAVASIVVHVEAMLALQKRRRRRRSTTATTSAAWRKEAGVRRRLRLPGLRARVHPAALLRAARARSAGWRSAAIPQDIAVTDDAVLEAFPDNEMLARWIEMAARAGRSSRACPARICWLGYGERAKAGLDLQRPGAHAAR